MKMIDSVAGHFFDELVNWSNTSDNYVREILELESKLSAFIQQNTIPNLALNAEKFLNQLLLLQTELDALEKDIYQQELSLKQDDALVDNQAITVKITGAQDDLRNKMKIVEKNFVDLKYNCYEFLADIHKK